MVGAPDDILLRGMAFTTTGLESLKEKNTKLNLMAMIKAMGGVFNSGLDSSTKYLIVFAQGSDKYLFSIRKREDVVLLKHDFVELLYKKWKKGDELNLEQEIREGMLKPFSGKHVCFTNIESSQRSHYGKSIVYNGGNVSQDLHKTVNVLVSSCLEGKKCEYAQKWGIPVVKIDWVIDSISAYAPLPTNEYLLVNQYDSYPSYRKFKFQSNVSLVDNNEGRASQKPIASMKRKAMNKEWDNNLKLAHIHKKNFLLDIDQQWDNMSSKKMETSGFGDNVAQLNLGIDVNDSNPITRELKGSMELIFQGCIFYLCGFDSNHNTILQKVIESQGGVLSHFNDPNLTHIIIYSYLDPIKKPNLSSLSDSIKVLTEWFIERSLCKKKLIHDEWGHYCEHRNLIEFKNLKISISGFTGSDLPHIERLIKILGAEYHEFFTPDVDILVSMPGSKKEQYAYEWNIPIVDSSWLWECAKTGKLSDLLKKPILSKNLTKHDSKITPKTTLNLNSFCQEYSSSEIKKNDMATESSEWAHIITSKTIDKTNLESSNEHTSPNKKKKLVGRSHISTLSSSVGSSHQEEIHNDIENQLSDQSHDTTTEPKIKYLDSESIRKKQALFEELGDKAGIKASILLTQETTHAEDCFRTYMRPRY